MGLGDNPVARREGITTDTLDLAERYVRHIAHDHPEYLDEAAMHRWQRRERRIRMAKEAKIQAE